jgi:hypothetical protein
VALRVIVLPLLSISACSVYSLVTCTVCQIVSCPECHPSTTFLEHRQEGVSVGLTVPVMELPPQFHAALSPGEMSFSAMAASVR